MIFTVYRLELFKMLKRPAAWVTYLSFLTITILLLVAQRYGAPSHGHGFPDTLPALLTGDVSIASTFGVVLLVLMTCGEFDWKTSRQNIIDGLSKRQWWVGKALLIPTIAIALYLTRFAAGGTLALIATSTSHAQPYDPTATYVLAGCGVLLGMLCYASIALLICMTVRSAGPAVGAALVYQIFDNIAALILRTHHLGDIAQWLPLQVQNALVTYNQYQPHGGSARNPLEGHWHTELLFLAAAAWMAVMLCVSYRVYMKRDL
ncbi:MAG: ABC transporter permease [Steroidobacteraceae bacterium]